MLENFIFSVGAGLFLYMENFFERFDVYDFIYSNWFFTIFTVLFFIGGFFSIYVLFYKKYQHKKYSEKVHR